MTVAEADTAISMVSGDVPVLATPRVVALCEAAACAAVAGSLEPGLTSVGTWIEMEHLAPSPVGAVVVAEAVLSHSDGRRLEFDLTVSEGGASGRARPPHQAGRRPGAVPRPPEHRHSIISCII